MLACRNDACSYWKYICRNGSKRTKDMSQNEYDDNNDIEFFLKQLKSALETFIQAGSNLLYGDSIEYVLVYTVW